MGWNSKCKRLRRLVFQGNKDRNDTRLYTGKDCIVTDEMGFKYKRTTLSCLDRHKEYQLLKRLYKLNVLKKHS